jgi:hypothetical protein
VCLLRGTDCTGTYLDEFTGPIYVGCGGQNGTGEVSLPARYLDDPLSALQTLRTRKDCRIAVCTMSSDFAVQYVITVNLHSV